MGAEYARDMNMTWIRITRLLNTDPTGKEMFVYKYAYDGNGNPILKEENGKVTAYGYDALNACRK